MKPTSQLVFTSLVLLLCTIVHALPTTTSKDGTNVDGAPFNAHTNSEAEQACTTPMEITNVPQRTPTEEFLAACEANSYMVCLKLSTKIEKSEIANALKVAVMKGSKIAIQILLDSGKVDADFIQNLFEDYLSTPDGTKISGNIIGNLLCALNALKGGCDPEELVDIYENAREKGDSHFKKLPQIYKSTNDRDVQIAGLFGYLPLEKNSRFIKDLWMTVCEKGDQFAVFHLVRRLQLLDDRSLFDGYVKAIEMQREEFVEYFVKRMGRNVAILDGKLDETQQQWLQEIVERNPNMEGSQPTDAFLAAGKKKSLLTCIDLIPKIEAPRRVDVLKAATKDDNAIAMLALMMAGELDGADYQNLAAEYIGAEDVDPTTVHMLAEVASRKSKLNAPALLDAYFSKNRNILVLHHLSSIKNFSFDKKALYKACDVGDQLAVVKCLESIKDEDSRMHAYLLAVQKEHDVIVEYFLRRGLPKLVVGMESKDQIWVNKLVEERNLGNLVTRDQANPYDDEEQPDQK